MEHNCKNEILTTTKNHMELYQKNPILTLKHCDISVMYEVSLQLLLGFLSRVELNYEQIKLVTPSFFVCFA